MTTSTNQKDTDSIKSRLRSRTNATSNYSTTRKKNSRHHKKSNRNPKHTHIKDNNNSNSTIQSITSTKTQTTIINALQSTSIKDKTKLAQKSSLQIHATSQTEQHKDEQSLASIPSNNPVNLVDWPTIKASTELQASKRDNSTKLTTTKGEVAIKTTHKVSPSPKTQKVTKYSTLVKSSPTTIQEELQRPSKIPRTTQQHTDTNNGNNDSTMATSTTTPATNSPHVTESKNNTPLQDITDDESMADTVASGQTLRPGEDLEESNNSNLNIIRYTLQFNISKIDTEAKKKELKMDTLPDDITDPDKRLHRLFKAWFKKLQEYDPTLQLLAWSKTSNDPALSKVDDLPSDPATLKKYFFGARSCEEGRVYSQIRLYSKLTSSDLIMNMKAWITKHNARHQRCLVQSEYAVNIGWLVYSSNYTDLDHLKKEMEKRTSYEWGFKIGAVTNSDRLQTNGKATEWKNRMKCVTITVSHKYRVQAINKAREIFSSNVDKAHTKPAFAQQYIFLPPEHELQQMPNCVQNYMVLRARHEIYNKRLCGLVNTSICTNIDKAIHTTQGSLSLRQMITRIPSTSTHGVEGFSLYQTIDATTDGSTSFFKNRRGPKGPGFILSFMQRLENEATLMARGLPVYLAKIYGFRAVRNKFTVATWEDLTGWEWDIDTNTFVTPDTKMVEDLVMHDPMANLLNLEEADMNTTTAEEDRNQEAEKELLLKFNDTDADSVRSLSKQTHDVATVNVPGTTTTKISDDTSTTSSVTFDTTMDNKSTSSTKTFKASGKTATKEEDDGTSIKSSTTLNTLNTTPTFLNQKKLDAAWDPSLSVEENTNNRKSMILHSLNKFQVQAQQQIAALNLQTGNDNSNKPPDFNPPAPVPMKIATQRSRCQRNTINAQDSDEIMHKDEDDVVCIGTKSTPEPQLSKPLPTLHDDPNVMKVSQSFRPILDDDYSTEVCSEIEKFTTGALKEASIYTIDDNECLNYEQFMSYYKPDSAEWTVEQKMQYRATVMESPTAAAFINHYSENFEDNSWAIDEETIGNVYMQYRTQYPPPSTRPFQFPAETIDQYRLRINSDRPPNAPTGGLKAGRSP